MENRKKKNPPTKPIKFEKNFDKKRAEEFAAKFSKENEKVLRELAKK